MCHTPSRRKGDQQVGNALHFWDWHLILDYGMGTLRKRFLKMRRKKSFCLTMCRTLWVALIVTGTAGRMREVMLTYQPCFDNHGSIAHLAQTITCLEYFTRRCNGSDVDTLSCLFSPCDKCHTRFSLALSYPTHLSILFVFFQFKLPTASRTNGG